MVLEILSYVQAFQYMGECQTFQKCSCLNLLGPMDMNLDSFLPECYRISTTGNDAMEGSDRPGGEVTVHEVLRGQVDHPGRYLLGNVQHLTLGQLHRSGGLALGHQNRVRTMSPVKEQAGNDC